MVSSRSARSHSRSRILITTDFYEPWQNGVATYVKGLASSFPNADVTILTYNVTSSPAKEKHGNVTIVRVPCTSILGKTFVLPQLSLPKESVLPAHDIVITNTRFFTTTITGQRLARHWHVPHIHVEHGNRHVPHRNPLVRLIAWTWDQTIGRVVFHSADLVVCVSRAGTTFVKRLGAKHPLIIPNAIDASSFELTMQRRATVRAAFRKKYHITNDAHVVLFVGRLVAEKGVADLIDALSATDDASNANSPATLVVIGDGKARDDLVSRAESRNVRACFLGSQSQDVIRDALAAADIFVNPSHAEGLPTSVLEALAAGVPVIATDVGGTREILPLKCLVPARDARALRAALARGIAKPAAFHAPFPREYDLKSTRRAWTELLTSFTKKAAARKVLR